jgi:Rrf2 family transcriptional regulator, nitric oxide-sensitive transcriptional repressor
MKLTAFTDYSLRVLIYLATQPERRATIGAIAAAFDISEHHLTKVVHFLGKKGWLANVRGKGGGLELAALPELIGVGDVVRHTEGHPVPAECFEADGGHCSIADICELRGVLGRAVKAFYAVLDQYTLADLVHNRKELAAILFVERPVRASRRPAS